jgi:amino acid adenylation domain-containing protein
MNDQPKLHHGFLRWAATDPGLPAVVAGDDCRTYGQLYEQASALAARIVEHGSGSTTGRPPARVGLFARRGPDAYAAVLGILLAGAAYVPINPDHPAQRIAQTLASADVDLIVADAVGDSALNRSGSSSTPGPPVASVGPLVLRPNPERPAAAPTPADDQMAYLLFTSGTTGVPKGVPITHDNVLAFLETNLAHYRLGPGDHCSQTFDLTFDLSVFDLFMTWSSGACLHTFGPAELLAPVEAVAAAGLSTWFSVPAVAALQLRRGALTPNVMPSLRYSLFCGEALPVDVAAAWAAAAPKAVTENLYGPTEVTIACLRHRFHPAGLVDGGAAEAGAIVPIGVPFDQVTTAIVSPEGRPVPQGEEGELCLAGPQRFAGYWRDPDRTAARMVELDGVDHYRTGDRVRHDGALLHFIGRFDDQVQVLGHRVELGEVETAVRAIDDVVDAVAVGLPLDSANVTEIGVAVTLTDGSATDARALRRDAATRLPSSMAPRRMAILDRLPLNANGKTDRQATARLAFGTSGRP